MLVGEVAAAPVQMIECAELHIVSLPITVYAHQAQDLLGSVGGPEATNSMRGCRELLAPAYVSVIEEW